METKVLYGVEGNSTFLECVAKAPLGGLRWTVRSTDPQSNNPQTTRPAEGDRQVRAPVCLNGGGYRGRGYKSFILSF